MGAQRNSNAVEQVARIFERLTAAIRTIAAPSLTQLVLRLALAVPFWRSGVNKWDGFLQLNETAIYLFSSEFKLHLPGGPYPFPVPSFMAFVVGCAEIALPILLVLGLGTRLASFAIFVMTIVVQFTVPDGWPIHLTWAAMALGLMAWGAGMVSFDHWLLARTRGKPASQQHPHRLS